MRECPKCGKQRTALFFYPDAAWREGAWCKRCIDQRRGKSRSFAADKSQRLLRIQNAVCAVMDSYQANGEPFVYLMKHGDAYKIGFSTNVSQRVRSFNTAHSKPVQIVAVAPGGRREELTLHAKLNHRQIAREWFAGSLDVFEAFQELPGAMVFLSGHCRQDAPTFPAS